jgi:ubiquitin-protein ligase
MDMKNETGSYVHHYANMASRAGTTPPPAKLIRLAQELADLSTSLPIEITNSIFIRVDDSRVDMMKCLIMGSVGTPYAHGAFEFDIFFEDNYPNAPPKVNLETTGSS